MIDPNTEYIYNVILSIALGVILVLFINQIFTRAPLVVSEDFISVTNRQVKNCAALPTTLAAVPHCKMIKSDKEFD